MNLLLLIDILIKRDERDVSIMNYFCIYFLKREKKNCLLVLRD